MPFFRHVVDKYFLSLCSSFFQPLIESFSEKSLKFDEAQINRFSLWVMHFVLSLRILCIVLDPKDIVLFFPSGCIVLYFTFKSVIRVELVFVRSVTLGQRFGWVALCVGHVRRVPSALSVDKSAFLPLDSFPAFVKN